MDRISLQNAIILAITTSTTIGLGLWAMKFYPLKTFLLGTSMLMLLGGSSSGYGAIAAYRRGPIWAVTLFGLSMILLLVMGSYLAVFAAFEF